MEEPTERPHVYSIARSARTLDLSTRTITRLIAASKIKSIRISERRIGIPIEEIERIARQGVA